MEDEEESMKSEKTPLLRFPADEIVPFPDGDHIHETEDPPPYYPEPEDLSSFEDGERKEQRTSLLFSLFIAAIITITLIVMTKLSEIVHSMGRGRPFLTIWTAFIPNVLLLPLYLLFRKWRGKNSVPKVTYRSIFAEIFSKTQFTSWLTFFIMIVISTTLYIVQFYSYLKSPQYTYSGSSIAIFNGAAALIYILSVIFLKEKISPRKVLAVVLCVSGVGMIGFSDQKGSERPQALIGDGLAALSAVIFSVYMVHYNYYIRERHIGLLFVYISWFGAVVLCLFWGGIPLFYKVGLENAPILPVDGEDWMYLILIALTIFVSNLAIWIGTPYTSPLFISIANIIAIPCGYLVDVIIKNAKNEKMYVSILFIIGMVLVIIGFGFLNIQFGCGKKKGSKAFRSRFALRT